MLRRLLLIGMAAFLVVAVAAVGGLYWLLSSDGIRLALERQASTWLGQPVRIAVAGAQIWPRLAIRLQGVDVGAPVRLSLAEVEVSTQLRALLDRRIADAAVRIRNTRLELPLPFAIPTGGGAGESAEAASGPVRIESINAIAFDNVRIVSRGHELVMSGDSSFDGTRLTIRRVTVDSGQTSIRAEGIVTMTPRVDATLRVAANRLDVDELLALANAFSTPVEQGGRTAGPTPRVAARISAETASAGGVAVRQFAAELQAEGDKVTLSPLTFQLFGGRYQGSLGATLGPRLSATLRSRLLDLDVAELAAFGNSPDTVTGRLSGAATFSGAGENFADVLASARGDGTAQIVNGTIRRLGLVRTVVAFFGKPAADAPESSDRFDRMDMTFALQNHVFRAEALSMHSTDVDLAGSGTLDTATTALSGKIDLSLSEALSAQAGNDLQRYTREGNRIVLPANIGGSLASPRVTIDAAAAVKRGLRNEVEGRLKGLLDRFARPDGN